MESGKKWTKKGNEKQFGFTTKIKQILVEDLRVAIEDWFGCIGVTIPGSIEDMVCKGEKEIDMRIKMLELADKADKGC